jgi:hypothetical protein
LRGEILKRIHESHQGMEKTKQLAKHKKIYYDNKGTIKEIVLEEKEKVWL